MPHIQIVGGGYNDMFGYQWGAGSEPYAFGYVDGYGIFWNAELNYQANIGVSTLYAHRGTWGDATLPQRRDPDGQVGLFSYIIDTNRPSLHPIAIVTAAYDSFGPSITSGSELAGAVGQDYPGGVYFVTSTFNQDTPYTTIDPASGSSASITIPYNFNNRNAATPFFRIRITQVNWTSAIHAINHLICNQDDCGTSGYTDPTQYGYQSYRLKYAGVIGEVTLMDDDFSGGVNDSTKDQLSMGVSFHDFGVYHRN